ncbi:hypothetical protein [Methanoregula sp.]|jgi:hypothetical protein|uniref:hypothetical protein n=1 Tax=Methanoregula sp. TaxID=2052170 RepID=UPI003C732FD4
MGSTKDVMELFAERDIRHMLPEYDGWRIERVPGSRTPGCFYRISRSKGAGTEIGFIALSLDPVPKEELINTLDLLPDDQGSLTKKYLLTPQATDTSGIPPHVRVLLMNAFAFAEGKLVWLTKKKNAKRIVQEQAVAA